MLNMMQINQSVLANRQYLSFRRKSEQGVVLLIALIVLVAMTLAGVALIRSTYTSNLIAGNLSFSQAATQAADIGTERALTFLRSPANVSLYVNDQDSGYAARVFDPEPGVSWEVFWQQLIAGKNSQNQAIFPTPVQVTDSNTGAYSIAYVIHRLCDSGGAPNQGVVTCAQPPRLNMDGESRGSGGGSTIVPQVYYRITVRVAGPRNTQSFIQTVVAI